MAENKGYAPAQIALAWLLARGEHVVAIPGTQRSDHLEANAAASEIILSAEEIVALQRMVREVPVTDHVIRYALSLVRQTRIGSPGVPDFVEDMISWGAGPRAVQFLILGGKARALMYGRDHVSTDDISALACPVLRHRIVVNFAAESDGVTADQIIERLISVTPAKEDELTGDARFQKIFAS